MNYKQYLYEEFLGIQDTPYHGMGEPASFYINPKSIKRMPANIRGISDEDGNFYVCDDPEYLHGAISKWLRRYEFFMYDGRIYDLAARFEVMLWERDEKTNNFFLSDSSSDYLETIKEYELDDFLPKLSKMYKFLKRKNPQYNFYFYYVTEFPKDIDELIKN